MDNYLDQLRQAGLTGNEAKVYLELIRRGSLPTLQLSRKLSMDRTLVYQILHNLLEKGLVSYTTKDKKYFQATDPDNLLIPIKEKESVIAKIIPELKKINRLNNVKHEVIVLEGKRGLHTYFKQGLKEKELLILGGTGKSYDVLKYELPQLSKEVNIKAKMILDPSLKNHKMTKIKGMQIHYLNIKSKATTVIFKNKIGIHVVTDKPLIALIENQDIADSYRAYFNFLWKTIQSLANSHI